MMSICANSSLVPQENGRPSTIRRRGGSLLLARLLPVAWLWIVVPSDVHGAQAVMAEPAADAARAPARQEAAIEQFRRIFVPADRVEQVTHDHERFLPIDRAEFEGLLQGSRDDNRPPEVRITRALFRARLESGQLVQGSAELDVQHMGEGPAWLPVHTQGLAVADLRWADGRSAASGTYFGDRSDRAEHGLVVARPGTAQFAWTARGRPMGDGSEFHLRFPRAVTTELIVVVPTATRLTADGASVLSRSTDEAGGVAYRLAVRGGEPLSLRATGPAVVESGGRLAVRHVTTYDVTASATQVETQLRVAPFAQPVREIAVRVPPSLHVLALTLGGQSLSYTETPAPDGSSQKLLTIELSQPLAPGETELRIRGITTTRLDRPLTLPSFDLARSAWLGGTVHLALVESLQLRDLSHDGFRPVGSEESENSRPNRWTFEQTNGTASLQVRVGRAPKRIAAHALTSVEIGREEVLAEATADVTSANGAQSILDVELAAGWEISSVESQPAGLVRSWSVNPDGDAREMTVVLDRPVAPQHPVRLRFRGRRPRPLEQTGLSTGQLAFVRFPHLSTEEQWVEVVSGSTLEVIPDGTISAQGAARGDLPPGLQSLVGEQAGAYLLSVRPDTGESLFRIRPRSAELAADVEINAEVTGSVVRYACRFRIQPRSGAVSRLGVVFSEPVKDTLRWRLIGREGRDLAAERIAGGDEPTSSQEASRIVRWQLAQPNADPFDLVVSFDAPWEGVARPMLAAIEAAGSQSGRIRLSADRSVRLVVENRGLDPLDSAAEPDRGERTQNFAYRYQPERVLRRDADPPLVIRRVGADKLAPAAWVRTARLDSVYLPNGRISNHLSLSVENTEPGQLDIDLPRAERILYRAGGAEWRQVARASRTGRVTVPLTSGSETVPLQVRYSQRRRPLGTAANLKPLPIRFSVPTGHVDHHVWVPAEYRALKLSGPAERLLAGLHVLGGGQPTHELRASADEFAGRHPAGELRDVAPSARDWTALEIVDLATLRLWCLAMLVMGLVMGTYLSRLRRRFAVVASAGGFGGALFLPVAYAPLASALAWGCLAAVVVGVIVVPLTSLVRDRLPLGARPQEAVATIAMLFLGLALSRGAFSADTPPSDPSAAPIYRVIDPIDDDRQPAGDHVFVPESLYSALLRRERERRAPLDQWLITRCRVRGAVAQSGGPPAASVPSFSVTLDLETFHGDAEVRLPFGGGDPAGPRMLASARVSSVRVDGAVPSSRWSEDGQSLHVRIAQPGPHHLELSVVPQVQRKGGRRELSLPLVAVPECSVEIAVSEDMPELSFPGLLGEVTYLPGSSTYRGHAGPVSKLVVSWLADTPPSAASAQADLLTWMYVQRTVSLLEQRLVIHAEGDEPLYVEVVPPAGARYLPSARELPYASISAAASGRVTLAIQPQVGESLVIPLQFLHEHPAGTLSLAAPRFTVEGGVQVVDRWLAVQSAPDLAVRPEPGTSAEVVEPGAFLDRWGSADTLPVLAFREYADASSWRIGLEARAAHVEASESTTAIASPSGVEVRYRADARVTDGNVLLQRLEVPDQLIVSSVEVVQDGFVAPARWSETEEGPLRILLPQPIGGPFTLRVAGEVPADEEGRIVIPLLSLDAEKTAAPGLTVGRMAGTVLELERSDALQRVDGASLPTSWQDDWYLHGQYTWSAATAAATSVRGKVRPAVPPRGATTVTALAPDLGGWAVAVHCHLRGIQQPLDRLVFVAPHEWEGPYVVDPADRWQVTVLEGSPHNRIVAKPRAPTAGEVRMTLRGQLAADRQDQVTIPSIRLVEPAVEAALVALPQTNTSGQATNWETRNLIGVDDAAAARDMLGTARAWHLYRASAAPATARIGLIEQNPSSPLISFIETVAYWNRERRIFTETTFSLDPKGRRSCGILLPDGYRLLDVRVNGRRLSSHRTAPRQWRIQLDSGQLPQLITVTCQSESVAIADTLPLHAPTLIADGAPIPVLQTAWQVLSDRPCKQVGGEAAELAQVSGSMLAAVRTANLVESLDEIMPALVGSSTESWARWLAYWRGRIAAAQERYALRAESEPADGDAAQALQTALQRLARIAEALPQLPRAGSPDATVAEGPIASPPHVSGRAAEFDLRLLGDGGIPTIRIRMLQASEDFAVHRWAGTLLLGLVAFGLATSHRRGNRGGWGSLGTVWPFSILFVAAVIALLTQSLGAIVAVLAAGLAVVLSNARGRRGLRASDPGADTP